VRLGPSGGAGELLGLLREVKEKGPGPLRRAESELPRVEGGGGRLPWQNGLPGHSEPRRVE